MKKKGLRYVLIALAIAIGLIWLNSTPKESYNGTPRQYKEIISSGVLRAVTEYNAVSYHVDQDTTLSGFDYEILREFAQSKNLKLQVVPEMNFSERLTGIANGRYDILAVSTPITSRTNASLYASVAASQAGIGAAQKGRRCRQLVHKQPVATGRQTSVCGKELARTAAHT